MIDSGFIFKPVKEVKVSLNFGDKILKLGRLAILDRQIYFEYDRSFIESGLEISPLRLPLKLGLASFDNNLFEGLPGVFYDSLPDGWGRLLLDRFVRSKNISPSELSPLDRLTYTGQHGMGALVYEPDKNINEASNSINLDHLASEAQKVLNGTSEDVLTELISLNGSSAGARPKALIGTNNDNNHIIHGAHELPLGYEAWIVKFPNSQDSVDAGAIEYVYMMMAKDVGIITPETYLFPAQKSPGYFSTKRFDRNGKKRYHMHTAGGLLHSYFRTPSLDYQDLIALTGAITRDINEIERMYQLAVFNVLSHNCDDHAKNFSFLMDQTGKWKLAPAYDLTFSSGPGGEQSTMVMGKGKDLKLDDLVKLGEKSAINKKHILEIIDRTRSGLNNWHSLAKTYGVSNANTKLIGERLIS